jgi:hypothetical protein
MFVECYVVVFGIHGSWGFGLWLKCEDMSIAELEYIAKLIYFYRIIICDKDIRFLNILVGFCYMF